jgi:hypothetical protein
MMTMIEVETAHNLKMEFDINFFKLSCLEKFLQKENCMYMLKKGSIVSFSFVGGSVFIGYSFLEWTLFCN